MINLINTNAPNGATINLVLESNDALNNGKAEITAVATVTQADKRTPISGVTVYFILLESNNAVFTGTDGKNQITGNTDERGTISKAFTDTMAETGEVHVYIIIEGGDKPSNNKEFVFKSPEPDKLVLTLDKAQAEANGKTAITATATVTENNIKLGEQKIHFVLPDSAAVFTDKNSGTDPNGYSITWGITDENGQVSKPFTDSTWEQGEVHAYFDLGVIGNVDNKVDDNADFLFTEPTSLTIQMQPLTCITKNGSGQNVVIENNKTVADGVARFIASAIITVEDVDNATQRIPLQNTSVVFELPDGGHTKFTLTSDDIANGATSYVVTAKTDSNGKASTPAFTSSYIGTGTINAYVVAHAGSKKQDNKPFSFTDPWQNITDLYSKFAGGVNTALIYANGLHQAQLQLKLTLASLDAGEILVTSNQPDLETVANSIKFINYENLDPLGDGTLNGWHVSRIPNIYDKHLLGQNMAALEQELSNESLWVDRVENGIAYLTYYFTCDSDQSNKYLQLGMTITPSAANADPIYNALGNNSNWFHDPVSLQANPEIVYNTSHLNIVPRRAGRSGEHDDYATEDSDNLWRHWDYQVRFNDGVFSQYGTSIFRCVLCEETEKLLTHKPFTRVSNMFYNFAGYFWPNNVYDSNGKQLASSDSYSVRLGAEPTKCINLPSNNTNTLYFTLYSVFGNGGVTEDGDAPGTGELSVSGYNFVSSRITLFDQYGNHGYFTVDPRNIPKKFSLDGFNDWFFITDGHITINKGSPGSYPDTFRILSEKYQSSVLDYNTGYEDVHKYYFWQICGRVNSAQNNTFKILEKGSGDTGIVLSANGQYYNFLYPINYPSTGFSDVVYSLNSLSSGDSGYSSFLFPVWNNNTMIIKSYTSYVCLLSDSDYARMRNYIPGDSAFEFNFVL
ncbi:TPA: Ig-like domain-containing protein [Yersinia enterocolitica]|uniref:Ig-like domain-containing protein n=1 Tax=Yersinia enterocolitica TaxID=630 RepID=UPI0032F39002|nr:Ig-like domain-containing protein [Yersinia enterocolitica]HDL6972509.1 Ig-like domain-containing protein [Yersinia enterocolitica]HDL6976662.1 Ig-like domain-containing protein [Yersinia enterocolitica]HDL6989017.1 Ig-like domain-containing protein [Yersinia enterocolitica]HDL6997679.1 Ig-like domain-containing protein [Yersinia enterocolitica]